jgi:hypothetical protein
LGRYSAARAPDFRHSAPAPLAPWLPGRRRTRRRCSASRPLPRSTIRPCP